ncbi:hypothetical protein M3Y95_01024400 [Aphelenchoides besseyi]|nr:hypothetical protein M3Y95_01024400 [Aphelenchoides besseyi]
MIGFIVVVLLMRVVNACDPTSIILPLMRSDIGCSGTSSSYEELNCKEFVDIMSGCCVGFARMKELQSGAEQCTELSNYKFNNETDYLQLYKVSYKEAASDPYTDACSWKLPIKRPKQTLSDGWLNARVI